MYINLRNTYYIGKTKLSVVRFSFYNLFYKKILYYKYLSYFRYLRLDNAVYNLTIIHYLCIGIAQYSYPNFYYMYKEHVQ